MVTGNASGSRSSSLSEKWRGTWKGASDVLFYFPAVTVRVEFMRLEFHSSHPDLHPHFENREVRLLFGREVTVQEGETVTSRMSLSDGIAKHSEERDRQTD